MYWINLWRSSHHIYFIDNIYDLQVISIFDKVEKIFQTTIEDKISREIIFSKISMDWDQMLFWHKFGRNISIEIDLLWKEKDDQDRL